MVDKIHSLVDLEDENTQRIWLEELKDAVNGVIDTIEGKEGTKFNLVDNADFVYNQEGFTSKTIVSGSSAWAADRHWCYLFSSAGVTCARDTTDFPSVAECGARIYASISATITSADTALAADEELVLVHRVEGYDWNRHIRDRECTYSFWVKSNTPGSYYITIQDSTPTVSYVHEIIVAGEEEWEQHSVTFTSDDTIGTWDTTNGIGMSFILSLGNGSTWNNSVLDSWIAGNKRGPSDTQENLMATNGNYFKFAAPQLEPGPNVTDFMQIPYQITSRKCKRYYQKNNRLYGHALDTTQQWFNWPFEVEMRGTPVIRLLTTTPYTEHPPFQASKSGTASTLVNSHRTVKSCDGYINGFTGLTTKDPSMITENQLEADARI